MSFKKLFLLVSLILPLAFFSCGGDDGEEVAPSSKEDSSTLKVNDLVGVWRNGNYFISFSEDDFFTGWPAKSFLDRGDYTIKGNVVSVYNPYFHRTNTYTITLSQDGKSMSVLIDYYDAENNEKLSDTRTFTKTEELPAIDQNPLANIAFSYFNGVFEYITYTNSSAYFGVKSAHKGEAAKHPINYFYIYLNGSMYYQQYPDTGSGLGGWVYYAHDIFRIDVNIEGATVDVTDYVKYLSY